MATGDRTKIAVLGGGPAAIAAACGLTSTAELRERFEVTVYQPGWRLGGKCATGRNTSPGLGERIEEHGLHVWFGFYENSFALMREAFAELGRPAGDPLGSVEQAFEGCDDIVLFDRQDGGWHGYELRFPRNKGIPGAGEQLAGFWDVAAEMCAWTLDRWQALGERVPPQVRGHRPLTPGWPLDLLRALSLTAGADVSRGGEQLLRVAHDLARARRLGEAVVPARLALPLGGLPRSFTPAALLALLLTRFRDWVWEHVARDRCEQDPELRLFFSVLDIFASATAGIVHDGVLEDGWEAINDEELCDWLARHGAKEVTVGPPDTRTPLLRALYDLTFAYPGARIASANLAAGAAMNALLRIFFTYRGSLVYRMRAGMGETVIAPLFELLRRRGVRFEFFHAVTGLGISEDGMLERIEVVPQARVLRPPYEPLITVAGLDAWPSVPLWEQLEAPAGRAEGNFELDPNPLGRPARALRRGVDFDAAVLGIPVGALGPICDEMCARLPRFAEMLHRTETVATQGVQLWLTAPTPEIGWALDTNSVSGAFVEPLSSGADMTHLLAVERWEARQAVRGIEYFCGVLDDREGESRADAAARVQRGVKQFLERDARGMWPRAGRRGAAGFRWELLAPDAGRAGPGRLASQYLRANTTGSERYVLTTAGSVSARLGAAESGLANLVLAGDWTRNGIDGGCVEAAVTSGLQAARALTGSPRRLTGESHTWLGRTR